MTRANTTRWSPPAKQVTAGLLAIVLEGMGVNARSWQGWQLPILTDNAHGSARILEVNGAELIKRFKEHSQVAVIAGFQGMHKETGRITTLGRGGSDTSAVAIAAAIGAERCDIYTDVDGVYTTDPRVVPKAHRMDKIAYEEMLELASLGAKVMQVRSVELGDGAQCAHLRALELRKAGGHRPHEAAIRHAHLRREETSWNSKSSPASPFPRTRRRSRSAGCRTSRASPPRSSVRSPTANINVDMIVQNVSADGATTDLTFTVPSADYERARVTLDKARSAIGFERLDGATDVAKVSVIGIGMRSHAGVAAKAFKALSEQKINILAITTSEIKFSVLIKAAQTDLAVRTLHTLYGLDKIERWLTTQQASRGCGASGRAAVCDDL